MMRSSERGIPAFTAMRFFPAISACRSCATNGLSRRLGGELTPHLASRARSSSESLGEAGQQLEEEEEKQQQERTVQEQTSGLRAFFLRLNPFQGGSPSPAPPPPPPPPPPTPPRKEPAEHGRVCSGGPMPDSENKRKKKTK